MTRCALLLTYWSDTGFYLYMLPCQLVSSPSRDWVRRAYYFGEENAVFMVSVSGLASHMGSAWHLAGCLQESHWYHVSVTALRDIERGLKTKIRSCRVNKESIPWRPSDQSYFNLFCQQCWKRYSDGCDSWQFRCRWLWTRSHFTPSSWPSLQLWRHCWLLYQLHFNAPLLPRALFNEIAWPWDFAGMWPVCSHTGFSLSTSMFPGKGAFLCALLRTEGVRIHRGPVLGRNAH